PANAGVASVVRMNALNTAERIATVLRVLVGILTDILPLKFVRPASLAWVKVSRMIEVFTVLPAPLFELRFALRPIAHLYPQSLAQPRILQASIAYQTAKGQAFFRRTLRHVSSLATTKETPQGAQAGGPNTPLQTAQNEKGILTVSCPLQEIAARSIK
ncbi:MAG: hypothetical protein OSB70_19785, partial [Myxococcota bacterium]|nr:hypothetical protein [Myxococcota bacterium]